MKPITFTISFLLSLLSLSVQAKNIDSLQRLLDTTSSECTKAELYTNIAAELIQFNGPKTKEISYSDAGWAIDCVLKAIHINSKYDDILTIRNNYNCLSSAYFIQQKYTQAKWFQLQSLNISRNRKDLQEMINSLMQLASIKIAIKDYKMAEKDFNEAIVLSKYKNDVQRQIDIERCLATLYDRTNRNKIAVAMEKHCVYLAANIQQIMVKQAKENQVRLAAQAKLAEQQAKANQIKMAELAKTNKANEAKLAIQQAKTLKVNEKRYLTILKVESKWPLTPITANAKMDNANQAKLAIQRAKAQKANEKKYLASLKAESKWPLTSITLKAKPKRNVQVKNKEEVKIAIVVAASALDK